MSESTQQPALKRCPFCGGAARFGKGKRRMADTFYQKAGEWIWEPSVGCNKCGFRRKFDSVIATIEWWNTRKGEQ